ncbi:MAG: aminoacyl-tRNA hydrolase [Candidatus Competibacteraceae bacterium]|nr:aminoacyl-tRNA hydrolase [Candidatus Competibacteraceae bacterium]MCP5125430.1 aminoacyl-tRNA hydrolase [Gammaproteobacteria bacterium]HRX69601.1 aminoacyl-tRNA hydrolase [Candidatus Competibacteraceae bacterium]
MAEQAPILRLVVGLGNPGPEYAQTRHNAGFWLVDALASQQSGFFRPEGRYHGETCRIALAGQELWLLKPMTYMNRSGQAVAALTRFHKIPLSAILVVHDDLDLPPGTVRLKRGGGHGGHNGLRDLIAHLGGNDFARLRLGIGHPGDSREVLDHVLRRAPRSEQELIEQAIADALRELPRMLAGQWERATHALHSRKIESSSPPSAN